MSKEILSTNIATGTAVLSVVSNIEMALTIAVLLTALFINIRNIIRGKDDGKSPS